MNDDREMSHEKKNVNIIFFCGIDEAGAMCVHHENIFFLLEKWQNFINNNIQRMKGQNWLMFTIRVVIVESNFLLFEPTIMDSI